MLSNLDLLDKMHIFHHLARIIFKDFDTSHLHLPLNQTQEKVLILINRGEKNYMNQISKQIGLEKGSFTSVVDTLIDCGYLIRCRDEQDRRKVALILTEKGAETAQLITDHMDRHLDAVFKNLSEQDKLDLFNAFDTIEKISSLM